MRGALSARTSRLLLATGGLALLAWLSWENLSDRIRPPEQAPGGFAQRLDVATTWQYGEDGALSYRLDTSSAVHLDEQDRYELTAPEAELFDADSAAPPWTLASTQGTLLDGGATVRLSGSVHGGRAPYRERGRLELDTERLWLYPRDRLARSDVPSRLRELGDNDETRWVSHADRLSLNWGTRVLTQTDRVRDVIRPATASR